MKRNGRPATRTVRIGSRKLIYSLRFADASRLTISVHPDLAVSVQVPHGADPQRVDARVKRKAAWIYRRLREFERYHPLPVPRRYVSGETHFYLGRQYRLRVRRGPERIQLSGPFLLVSLRAKPRPGLVRQMVRWWYRERAARVFVRRFREVVRRASWLGRQDPVLRIREMTTRWGSRGPAGAITLNVDLVKAPVTCIDYVIAHELCHGIEMRHSKRFYDLLRRAVPEWERAKDRLNLLVR